MPGLGFLGGFSRFRIRSRPVHRRTERVPLCPLCQGHTDPVHSGHSNDFVDFTQQIERNNEPLNIPLHLRSLNLLKPRRPVQAVASFASNWRGGKRL